MNLTTFCCDNQNIAVGLAARKKKPKDMDPIDW